MIEKIENQLAQLIIYIGAIDALAEAYRASDDATTHAFLFGTVYDALWDAAVVRIGTLWDETKGVASLPKLARQLDRIGGTEARAIARRINGDSSPEWTRLKEWRHTIVAHARFSLDAAAFDRRFAINVQDLRSETERIEQLIGEAKKAFGADRTSFEVLKDDATGNARSFLSRF
jgi:hypothetical protein